MEERTIPKTWGMDSFGNIDGDHCDGDTSDHSGCVTLEREGTFSLTCHYGDTHYVYSEKTNLSEDEHHITSISMHSNLIFYGMVSLRVNFCPPF